MSIENNNTTKSIRTAVFPGSFDPFHAGHIDVAKRALQLFDHLIIAVIKNPNKQSFFSEDQRIVLLKEIFKNYKNVEIDSFSGLLVDYLKHKQCNIVIRGLRAISDFDYEAQMALMNKNMLPGTETVFLVAQEEHSYISSSLIKQVATLGGDVSKIVPSQINKAIIEKLAKN
jgi:pantetheine-phosphate adenylyltransferase